MSLSDLILQSDDLPRVAIPTPEWPAADGKLFCRPLTGSERRYLERLFRRSEAEDMVQEPVDPRAYVCAKAICTGDGDRVFSDDQISAVAEKNSIVLDRAYDVIMRISGIRASTAEQEDARKNSEPTPGSDSFSA